MPRTVVVTGGGTGIGKAIAASFATAGDRVIITGRRAHMLKETAAALGENVSTFVCDATQAEQVEALQASLDGEVHVLVNNAGGNLDIGVPPATDVQSVAARWRANLESNLVSVVLTTTALDKHLASPGAVIHIGSFAADRGNGSYGAAKAGLAAWNVFLAGQLGPRRITSNVVSPGYIAETEFFSRGTPPGFHEARVAETMTNRAGLPEDIAAAVFFLASPQAGHITGQVINVNGGARTTR